MRLYQVTLAISITFRIKFNLGTRMLNETRYVRMNFLPHCNVIQRVTLPNTSTITNGFVVPVKGLAYRNDHLRPK